MEIQFPGNFRTFFLKTSEPSFTPKEEGVSDCPCCEIDIEDRWLKGFRVGYLAVNYYNIVGAESRPGPCNHMHKFGCECEAMVPSLTSTRRPSSIFELDKRRKNSPDPPRTNSLRRGRNRSHGKNYSIYVKAFCKWGKIVSKKRRGKKIGDVQRGGGYFMQNHPESRINDWCFAKQ